jgi:nitrogen regulatory protein P-II 1|tara:strand:- start:811 stop:1149 length:339 start_codon:yes stop_codon:yes gene_type:complete
MKKIEAIIRPEKLEAVSKALEKNGILGMTVSDVKGRGRQKGITLQWRAGDYRIDFIPKIKFDIVLEDSKVKEAIETICSIAKTDNVGDGKIFVYPIEDVIRVRTGESGKTAV